ncbi:MAG: hypothetical protein QG623_60 [Patescibacteria group bacterium]|nr:hypothetical protein [Patescibacteria group bacterium]
MRKGNKLGVLQTGEFVYDRSISHLQDSAKDYTIESLSDISSEGSKTIEKEVVFKTSIGVSSLVVTGPDDDIVFARRLGRKGYSRFVRHRRGEESRTLYIKLSRIKNESAYILVTSFIGKKTPPEPQPNSRSDKLRSFWSNHALLFDPSSIIPETLTNETPPEFLN